jgi:hypothetical protein
LQPAGKPATDLEYRLANIAEMKAACDAEIAKIKEDEAGFSETTQQMLFFTRDSLKAQMNELLQSASTSASPAPQARFGTAQVAPSPPFGRASGSHFYPGAVAESAAAEEAAGGRRKTPSFTEDVESVPGVGSNDGPPGSDAEAEDEWATLIGGSGGGHFYPGSPEVEPAAMGMIPLQQSDSPRWEFTGASGPKAATVDGQYVQTEEMKNGFPVFVKVGDDTKCCWVGPDGHWYLSSAVAKDANRDAGYAISIDPGATSPGEVSRWIVSTGAEFVPQPEVTATLVARGGAQPASYSPEMLDLAAIAQM